MATRSVTNTNAPASLTATSIAWPSTGGSGVTSLTTANSGNSSYSLQLPATTGTLAVSSQANVASVTSSDNSLTVSPTTGNVVATLNTAHGNTWTAGQTFNSDTTMGGNLTLNGTSKTVTFPDSTSGAAAFKVGYDLEGKLINAGICIHDTANGTKWLFQSNKAAGNVNSLNNILDSGSGFMQVVSFASNAVNPVDGSGVLGGVTAWPVANINYISMNPVWIGNGAGNTGAATNSGIIGIGPFALGGLAPSGGTSFTHNLALGSAAMNVLQAQNTGGGSLTIQDNMAIGTGAMGQIGGNNATASAKTMLRNIAIGTNAMQGTSSSLPNDNVAVGVDALQSVVSGAQCVAVGSFALQNQAGSTGDNTALGYNAGKAGTAITTGSQNTLVGSGAQVDSATANNRIAIGYNAACTADNTAVIGNSSISNLGLGSTTATMTAAGFNVSGAGAPQGLRYFTTTLSQAQIVAMNATPIQLIAAQGSGVIIWPTMWCLNYVAATGAGATAFINGGNIGLQWGSTAALGGPQPTNTTVTSTFLTSGTINQVAIRHATAGPVPQATTNAANVGVYISNTGSAFGNGTGGTTNASVVVQILYWLYSGFV